MKDIKIQALNNVNVVGKIIDVNAGSGTLSDGRHYERATVHVRVNQKIDGVDVVSEIPVSFFAAQYTTQNKPNPMYENLQKVKGYKTIQDHGLENADVVRFSRGNLQENSYVAKSGQFYHNWQIRGAFAGKGGTTEEAKFEIETYILDMRDEVDSNEEPTGRLIIKGGVVQYNGKLDVMEFIVETPDRVNYVQRTWEPETTVIITGRIRITTKEEPVVASDSSWGEVMTEERSTVARELIVTGGRDVNEEMWYDRDDIRKAFNVRKANIEQMQLEAKNPKPAAKPAAQASKYDWE